MGHRHPLPTSQEDPHNGDTISPHHPWDPVTPEGPAGCGVLRDQISPGDPQGTVTHCPHPWKTPTLRTPPAPMPLGPGHPRGHCQPWGPKGPNHPWGPHWPLPPLGTLRALSPTPHIPGGPPHWGPLGPGHPREPCWLWGPKGPNHPWGPLGHCHPLPPSLEDPHPGYFAPLCDPQGGGGGGGPTHRWG